MKTRLIPAAFAALALSSFGAMAADTLTTGVIKSIDPAKQELTLENGITYVLPTGFDAATVKVGEKVSVSWNMSGVKHMADAVKAAS